MCRIGRVIFGSDPRNLVLGIVAIAILAGSFSVHVYNNMTEEDTETLVVNGKEYAWEDIFGEFGTTTLDDREGVLLSELVEDTGLEDPDTREYRIIAADGYVKTVSWEHMRKGIIQESKESYFSELPKQFNVKDVVEIEVV